MTSKLEGKQPDLSSSDLIEQEENLSTIKSLRQTWVQVMAGDGFCIWDTPAGRFRETVDAKGNARLTRIYE